MTSEPAPGSSDTSNPGNTAPPPRLLDQLRQLARARGHAEPAVASFASWVRRFILFHGKRHPRVLGMPEIGDFLDHLARTEEAPLPALDAARRALTFLYRDLLDELTTEEVQAAPVATAVLVGAC